MLPAPEAGDYVELILLYQPFSCCWQNLHAWCCQINKIPPLQVAKLSEWCHSHVPFAL